MSFTNITLEDQFIPVVDNPALAIDTIEVDPEPVPPSSTVKFTETGAEEKAVGKVMVPDVPDTVAVPNFRPEAFEFTGPSRSMTPGFPLTLVPVVSVTEPPSLRPLPAV
jgi:hypothetical protein